MDIVEWLRKEAELIALDRLNEAADEIERLRADNKHWQTIGSQGIAIERELRTEIEWLRAVINTVLTTFEKDEAQGCRSRDRQFAIEILRPTVA